MNKWTATGNLTHEPELTETSSGIAVCRFSIAVRRNYRNSDGDYATDFFNCIAWRGLADTISKYVRKGDKVLVCGALEMRNYEDKDGNKRTAVEVNVSDIEFLTQKQKDDTDKPTDRNKNSSANRQASLLDLQDDSDIPF